MQLLIVEDERKTVALLSTKLRQEGFDVLVAVNGFDGLREALRGGLEA